MQECKNKGVPCIDCSNTQCLLQGLKEADCPKLVCDREREHLYDCDDCTFIDLVIEMKRQKLKNGENSNG